MQDDTCGFLRSGLITLPVQEAMERFSHPDGGQAAYTIRCILKENTYDVLPKIGTIYTGLLPVRQTRCMLEEGQKVLIGRTDGCANQEISFQMKGVYDISLELTEDAEPEEESPAGSEPEGERLEGGNNRGQIWTRVDDLSVAGYKDRVFSFSEAEQKIRFGDGIHGVQPKKGQKIYVKSLTCSRYGSGNVRSGELREFADRKQYPWEVTNPRPITGGRDEETVQELLNRMEESLFAQQRMVTEEDYKKAVRSVPGLQIDQVHVIAGSLYGEIYGKERDFNEIVLVVKPVSSDRRPVLSEVYRRKIEEYLEPLRLLNTKVSVVSPAYVGITVHGKIALRNDSAREAEQVKQVLKEKLDYTCLREPFGQKLLLDRLYSLLEAQEGVHQVYSLSLEQEGRGAVRQENGSLYLNEDTLSYLQYIDIEFCERK